MLQRIVEHILLVFYSMESSYEARPNSLESETNTEQGARACTFVHMNILCIVDVEHTSLSSDHVLSCNQENLESTNENAGADGSTTSDDVFLEDQLIDDCGVVEIDLVSTEIHTEYETVEEVEHYDGEYDTGVTHTGEAVTTGSEYNMPEAEGELPIIIEENKAAINLARNCEMLKAPAATMSSTQLHSAGSGNKQGNKVTPPPNQMQILAASLAGKNLGMLDSYQSSNVTVSRKPVSQTSTSP